MKTHFRRPPMKKGKPSSLLSLFLLVFFLSSCGSVIRQSTVQLSADVGNRITEMEHLHQLAIQRYFDVEKKKVEDFLTNTWEPLFLKNFLGTSQILQLLQNTSKIDESLQNQIKDVFSEYLTDPSEAGEASQKLVNALNQSRDSEEGVVKTVVSDYVEDDKITAATIHINSLLGTDSPAKLILDFAEAAHTEMNSRRQSLLAPIEQARSETIAELSAAYAELVRGQSTITGRLEAAAKVSQEQDRLLGVLGVNNATQKLQSKLSNFTTKIDGALGIVNGLAAEDSSGNVNLPSNILQTLQSELEKINDKTSTINPNLTTPSAPLSPSPDNNNNK
ncbi:MAG: hypothetical protein AAF985_12155 [Bacteroidota bacterium]